MKEVENKQAFYNNGIIFQLENSFDGTSYQIVKALLENGMFFPRSGILQPSVIVTASGVKLST